MISCRRRRDSASQDARQSLSPPVESCIYIMTSGFVVLWDSCAHKHVSLHLYVFLLLLLWFFFLLFVLSPPCLLFLSYYFLDICLFSKRRERWYWFVWEVRWEGSQRSWSRETHYWNILHEIYYFQKRIENLKRESQYRKGNV